MYCASWRKFMHASYHLHFIDIYNFVDWHLKLVFTVIFTIKLNAGQIFGFVVWKNCLLHSLAPLYIKLNEYPYALRRHILLLLYPIVCIVILFLIHQSLFILQSFHARLFPAWTVVHVYLMVTHTTVSVPKTSPALLVNYVSFLLDVNISY